MYTYVYIYDICTQNWELGVPAVNRSFTSIQMAHTHTHAHMREVPVSVIVVVPKSVLMLVGCKSKFQTRARIHLGTYVHTCACQYVSACLCIGQSVRGAYISEYACHNICQSIRRHACQLLCL